MMADKRYRTMLTEFSHKKSPYIHWFSNFISACPMTYHTVMFTTGITQLASEAQQKKYLDASNHWQVIGTYAQTELAHGSDV